MVIVMGEDDIKEAKFIPPIEIEVPIIFFDGWEVYDVETNEFLGWVNAKEKCIKKITITEICQK